MIDEGVCCVCYQSEDVVHVTEEDDKKRMIVNILQFCHQWKYPGFKPVSVCYKCITKLEVCHKLMQDHVTQQREARKPAEPNNITQEADCGQLVIDEGGAAAPAGSSRSAGSSCEYCDKVFGHRGDLNKHRRTHTGERPYTCSLCGRQFSHTSNLLRHRKIHSGETPFSCPVCNKMYSRRDKLAAHLKSCHTDTAAS